MLVNRLTFSPSTNFQHPNFTYRLLVLMVSLLCTTWFGGVWNWFSGDGDDEALLAISRVVSEVVRPHIINSPFLCPLPPEDENTDPPGCVLLQSDGLWEGYPFQNDGRPGSLLLDRSLVSCLSCQIITPNCHWQRCGWGETVTSSSIESPALPSSKAVRFTFTPTISPSSPEQCIGHRRIVRARDSMNEAGWMVNWYFWD